MILLSSEYWITVAFANANANIVVYYGLLFHVDSQSPLSGKKDGSEIWGISPNDSPYDSSSSVLPKGHEKINSLGEQSEGVGAGKVHGETQSLNSRGQPGSSTSSNSDGAGGASAFSGPSLSPCSSVGSLSSEKSTLNPHAKV